MAWEKVRRGVGGRIDAIARAMAETARHGVGRDGLRLTDDEWAEFRDRIRALVAASMAPQKAKRAT